MTSKRQKTGRGGSSFRGGKRNNDARQNKGKGREKPAFVERPTIPVDEASVGIKCFLGKVESFTGILKQRFQDFIVNEIDPEGNVVRLTNLNPPVEDDGSASSSQEEILKELGLLVDESKAKEFVLAMENSVDPKFKFSFEPTTEKDKRTALHKLIKKFYPKFTSETFENRVVVVHQSNNQRTRRTEETRGWPVDRPKYLQFTLYKENKDTTDALETLAKFSNNRITAFSFAGTKDKRACTTQRVTIFKVPAEQMSSINNKLFGIRMGDFKFVEKQLSLGDLSGNRFSITVRDIRVSDETVLEAVNELKGTGFVNYFGLQRFGSGSIPNHMIGNALLRCDWEKAVNLILDPRENENEESNSFRKYFKETADVEGALQKIPRYLHIERMLLNGLRNNGPKAFVNALSFIPRVTRMMFAHSYQSYIWNLMASERIELYGFESPVVGDLVIISEIAVEENAEENAENQHVTEVIKSGGAGEEGLESKKKYQVKVVTEEDVKNGTFDISRVVLPLPGFDTQYPENKIGDRYKEIIANDGLNPSDLHHKHKEYNLSGSYRRLIEKPRDFGFEIVRYDDYQVPLVLTDLDIINRKQPTLSIPTGKHKALVLHFSLPSSCYATMCFRELFKTPTHIIFQKSLNEEFKNSSNEEEGSSSSSKKVEVQAENQIEEEDEEEQEGEGEGEGEEN